MRETYPDGIWSLPGEIWKKIFAETDEYWVSNLARVKREVVSRDGTPGAYLIYPYTTSTGYLAISVGRNLRRLGRAIGPQLLHRVVAIAFIPNPSSKPEVNHKFGDKTDATARNLEWVSGVENKRHCVVRLGHRHPSWKLQIAQVITIKAALARGISCYSIARFFRVREHTIRLIKDGITWLHARAPTVDEIAEIVPADFGRQIKRPVAA